MVFLEPRLAFPTSSDLQLAESSKGLEADTSRQAKGDCLKLEVVQGTSLVGRGYSEGKVSEN